ncbi:DUF4136 domain-containing protein [Bacteroidota bacterium]
MKRNLIPVMILGTLMMSCLGSRDFVVESDYSYYGKFKRYKTYSFLDQQKYNMDTLVPDDIVQKEIQYRMSLLGYRETREDPNILIAYKLFFNDFKFNGYNQPELELWMEKEGIIDETFDPIKYRLKEGTLLILFVDRKQQKAIWQGYNSGLINPATLDNERYVKGSVRTIFDKYKIFARGYVEEG